MTYRPGLLYIVYIFFILYFIYCFLTLAITSTLFNLHSVIFFYCLQWFFLVFQLPKVLSFIFFLLIVNDLWHPLYEHWNFIFAFVRLRRSLEEADVTVFSSFTIHVNFRHTFLVCSYFQYIFSYYSVFCSTPYTTRLVHTASATCQ